MELVESLSRAAVAGGLFVDWIALDQAIVSAGADHGGLGLGSGISARLVRLGWSLVSVWWCFGCAGAWRDRRRPDRLARLVGRDAACRPKEVPGHRDIRLHRFVHCLGRVSCCVTEWHGTHSSGH